MKNQKLLNRVLHPNSMYSYCHVIGCNQPASAGTSSGLNQRFCRKHEDFYERHGSYYKSSYKAPEIGPYTSAARRWINANQDMPRVHRAILMVRGLYRDAGPHIEAFRLNGLSPEARAKAAWARLRNADVDPIRPLAAWIAIELITIEDPQAENKSHFKRVQAAKLIHRMASGTHKRWEQINSRGEIQVKQMHTYPRSRGKVLMYIGEQIQNAAELIVCHHLTQIQLIKSP
jgi:hypothetical protein